jgi:hypothetical protein
MTHTNASVWGELTLLFIVVGVFTLFILLARYLAKVINK